jgi:copper(I)-binding protein
VTGQRVSSPRIARACCALAVAAALTSSACAAGRRAQTADQKPTLDGTEATIGQLDLRGITIEAPTTGTSYSIGQSARMRVVIVNSGKSIDRLTAITSSAITGWGSYATAADATAAQAPRTSASVVPPAVPSTSSSSSASGSTSRSSTRTVAAPTTAATTTAAPIPQPSRSVVIPVNGRAAWGVPDSSGALVLSGLKQRLFSGSAVRLTFTFAKAGRLSVEVPVGLTNDPSYSYIPEPAGASASATD